MMAVAHMERYGTTREQMAAVAVKNHRNGARNPRAQFRHEISLDDVLTSVKVADPLRILDCSPITDGAAAIILCPADKAARLGKKAPVKLIGSGQASDTIALHQREELFSLEAVTTAATRAYEMAGKTPADIDLAELHDCFTIAEIIATEALGLCERGQGGKAVESGETAIGGRIPVNASGGLKAKGHPVGATRGAQVIEVVEQLRGEAGERAVEGAKVGLTQNMGGTGASAVVHILEAV
jgi:acetyl-CoA C-acetyltransferase